MSATGNILLSSESGYIYQRIVTHRGSSQDTFGSADDNFPLFLPCTFLCARGVSTIVKEKIIRVLLSAGADVNQRTALGETALHALCATCNSSYSPHRQFLLDDDRYNEDFSDDMSLIRVLIDHGANPNICNNFGESPLHYAAQTGYGYFAKFLLKNGANVYLKDKRGLTALEYASNVDYKLTLALIEKYHFPVEKVIQAYEMVAVLDLSDTAHLLWKATLLRKVHGIPKTVLPPIECYGYQKEWESLEELDKYGNDEFQLSLACLLAKERMSLENNIDVVPDHFVMGK